MNELYWITVLGNISGASLVILIISVLAWVALGVCFLTGQTLQSLYFSRNVIIQKKVALWLP